MNGIVGFIVLALAVAFGIFIARMFTGGSRAGA